MADYKTPQWLLPNEKNLAYPAAGAETGSGLSEDRHSLYSMDFDGTNDYISATNPSLGITDSWSVSTWVKTDDKTEYGGSFRGCFATGGWNTAFDFKLAVRSNNGYASVWEGGAEVIVGTSDITDNNWYNIVLTKTASDITLFVNGVQQATVSNSETWAFNNIYIGAGGQSTGITTAGMWNGNIDEVAIWNKALNQSEIDALSVADAPANLMALNEKPVAYYPLGEQAQMGSANWSFPNGSLQSHVVDFDGTDYVSTGLSLAYDDVPTWTISYWIKCDSPSFTNFDSYFAVGVDVSGGAYNYAAGRLYKQGGGLNAGIQGASFSFGTTNLSDGKWHNIVQTYVDQGSNVQTSNIYIDGNSTPEATSNTLSFQKLSGDLFLGFRNSGSAGSVDNPFIGEVSNVAVWSSDQSANLNNIYNNGSPQSTYTATPTAWWKLNAADSSYNTATSTWTFTDGPGTNDGTSTTLPSTALVASDLQFESPYSNYSLSFDGVIGNYIDCGTIPSFDDGDISFSLWCNLTSNGTFQYILSSTNTGSVAGINIAVHPTTKNLFFERSQDVANTQNSTGYSVPGFDFGSWHHLCGTYSAASGELKAYVNGILKSTTTDIADARSASTALKIGGLSANSSYPSNGNIDEVAIWNTALTQAQVTQVYNNGYPNDLTSLSPVSWWRLGEDAYFVGNDITIPNQITGGQTGTGSGTQTAILVGDAPGSYANGSGTNLVVGDRIGDAPESTANSVSINMIPSNRHSYPAGYTPTQVDNAFSMEFDGINDYYATNFTNFPTSLTNNFSVSFWVKMAPVSSGTYTRRHPVSVSTSVSDLDQTVHLRAWNTQYLVRIVGSFSGGGTGTTDISDNQWHNITYTYTYDSSTTYYTVNVYVDGDTTPEVTAVMRTTGGYNTQGLHTIGVLSDYVTPYNLNAGTYFPGFIDEVALFNYALSERQIKQDIYEGTTAGGKTADLNNISNLTAPVAWYRMGD